jgi:hypothetical protein
MQSFWREYRHSEVRCSLSKVAAATRDPLELLQSISDSRPSAIYARSADVPLSIHATKKAVLPSCSQCTAASGPTPRLVIMFSLTQVSWPSSTMGRHISRTACRYCLWVDRSGSTHHCGSSLVAETVAAWVLVLLALAFSHPLQRSRLVASMNPAATRTLPPTCIACPRVAGECAVVSGKLQP